MQENDPIIWEGDLEDDCTAHWNGLILRAEWMDGNVWWWAVSKLHDQVNEIDSSNNYHRTWESGEESRDAAEKAARKYIENLSATSTEDPDQAESVKGKHRKKTFVYELSLLLLATFVTILLPAVLSGFNHFIFTDAIDIELGAIYFVVSPINLYSVLFVITGFVIYGFRALYLRFKMALENITFLLFNVLSLIFIFLFKVVVKIASESWDTNSGAETVHLTLNIILGVLLGVLLFTGYKTWKIIKSKSE